MSNPVRRCATCPRMTRPPRSKLAAYPGTVLRRFGDLCGTCHYGNAVPPCAESLEYTIAGLNSFIRRRHERLTTQARANYYMERMSA